jgi:RsiW-degrading membrane proteinase PrsW (M82 family)
MTTGGWHPDPFGEPSLQRYYDGTQWTGHTAPVNGPGDPAIASIASTPPPPVPAQPLAPGPDAAAKGDRQLTILGAVCVAFSLAGVLMHALGLLSAPIAVMVILLPVGVGLRVALAYAARSAGSVRRAQVMAVISNAGLAISAITLVAVLHHLTEAGGAGTFVADLFANGWTLAIVTLAVGSVRTLGWRVFLGAGLTGFFAVPAIAALIGGPVVDSLGVDSVLATAGWAPVTEELLKALPVVLIAVLAVRRKATRPSAADLVLVGLWSGAGFALFENAVYGRGGVDFSAAPLASLLVPSGSSTALYGRPGMFVAGHMLHTGLLALGIAITLLYQGPRWRRWALPAAFLLALADHAAVNGLLLDSSGDDSPGWAKVLAAFTLHGWLSIILFFGGVAWIVTYEWRNGTRHAARSSGKLPAWLVPTRGEVDRRSVALASLQLAGGATPSPPDVGGRR